MTIETDCKIVCVCKIRDAIRAPFAKVLIKNNTADKKNKATEWF